MQSLLSWVKLLISCQQLVLICTRVTISEEKVPGDRNRVCRNSLTPGEISRIWSSNNPLPFLGEAAQNRTKGWFCHG